MLARLPAIISRTTCICVLGVALLPACTHAGAAQSDRAKKEAAPVGTTTVQLANVAPAQTAEPAVPAAKAAKAADASACPTGMVLVEGEYCPDVEQKCLEWMDPPTSRYHE